MCIRDRVKVVHLNVPVAKVTLDIGTQRSSRVGHVEEMGSHCAEPIRMMGIMGAAGAERAACNLDRMDLPMIESDERVRNDLIAELVSLFMSA